MESVADVRYSLQQTLLPRNSNTIADGMKVL